MDDLIGKKIKIIHIETGCAPNDKRWEGYVGRVTDVKDVPDCLSGAPNTKQIWVEGMSVSVLTDVDRYEVVNE